tara:strand:- start:8509 stop:8817 length:309 start_codon:yes stop_codon:yes gene_type:complete
MNGRFFALLIVLAAFGGLSLMAMMDVGYFGILEPHFQSWGGAQVFVDLVIVCLLACIWMVNDARTSGISAWPFVVLTMVAGSFGPLAYLLLRELKAPARAMA